MKILFFTGRNPQNQSGVSWKTWRIQRRARTVQVWWGPIKIVKRKIIPAARLQTRSWTFRTEDLARRAEASRIEEKLRHGYQRKPKPRA